MTKYQGRVVPWVTRWTKEEPSPFLPLEQVTTPYMLGGREFNVLKERDNRGAGEPQWARVHSRRASEATLKQICQVCGAEKSKLYLIMARDEEADLVMDLEPGSTVYGAEMPVCTGCVNYSLNECPHLKQADRTPVIADFNGIVGAIVGMGVNPPDYFVQLERFDELPAEIIVKQWVVQLVVREVIVDLNLWLLNSVS